MLVDQLQRGAGRLGGDQRVDDDPAAFAADEGDVGQVVTADLVDALGDLVQAVQLIEARLAPEGRVDAVRRLALDEVVGGQVPGGAAGVGGDDEGVGAGDQAPVRQLEVGVVGERQAGADLGLGCPGGGGGRFRLRAGTRRRCRAVARSGIRGRSAVTAGEQARPVASSSAVSARRAAVASILVIPFSPIGSSLQKPSLPQR
ncbi:MAG: hypothetical protein U5R48_08665 [Gammaproteobacteria bacterium]|nr:hypothetical protein [Gammaproteobacteria bacterium]